MQGKIPDISHPVLEASSGILSLWNILTFLFFCNFDKKKTSDPSVPRVNISVCSGLGVKIIQKDTSCLGSETSEI